MPRIDLRRDGSAIGLLVLTIILLAAGLAGAVRTFAYALVVFVGVLLGVGFVRRRDPVTWLPPVVAAAFLFAAFAGMFAHDGAVVGDVSDTVMGFHPATAYLVYVLWIPAFFTFGASLALVFDRLGSDSLEPPAGEGSDR